MIDTQTLPLPDFPKVRYSAWQLDALSPSQATYETPQFLTDESGIEVSGLTTTYLALSADLQAQGVRLTSLMAAQKQWPELVGDLMHRVIPATTDRFTAQNAAQYNTGIFLYIPAHVVVPDVLHLVLNQLALTGDDLVARLLIYVGAHAKVSLLQQLNTIGDQKTKASVVIELIAAADAQVNYANLDQFGPQTTAYINRQAQINDRATVDWANVAFSDGQVLTELRSHANGEGARTHVCVSALTYQKQTQGFVTAVQNVGRHSVGHIFQRGVILNKSTLVFNGIGRIIKGAKGADAQQESRVLMLSRRARGDANPLLLIDENDVTAGHAASVGRVDEQQLYYLMSRGLSQTVARRLVIRGFLGDVLAALPTPSARQRVIAEIERKLQDEQ